MSTEIVRRYRKQIPKEHLASLDTRIQWLWHQRWGTIQTIWKESTDVLDHMACTMFLQAVLAKDLNSVTLLFQRLEGGAIPDQQLVEETLVL